VQSCMMLLWCCCGVDTAFEPFLHLCDGHGVLSLWCRCTFFLVRPLIIMVKFVSAARGLKLRPPCIYGVYGIRNLDIFNYTAMFLACDAQLYTAPCIQRSRGVRQTTVPGPCTAMYTRLLYYNGVHET
jgi:hypothetical protein